MDSKIFRGCIPALMTPCLPGGTPNYAALVNKGQTLMAAGMNAVVYCGSMGDWPLLADEQRQEGVRCLSAAGVPVIVGTGARSSAQAAAHAAHAQQVGAKGLMVIPRLLSRGTSPAAQRNHFAAVLGAAPQVARRDLQQSVLRLRDARELFFDLRREFPNLVGFKEFGGADALRYAAEQITHVDDTLVLMVGVDTQVFHGFVNCGAVGAITGVGNCLPVEVLRLIELCQIAAAGDPQARKHAAELAGALDVLSTFDEGPDLVLYYKYLLVLLGDRDYELHFNSTDQLSQSQRNYAAAQLRLFQQWWERWPGRTSARA